MEHDAPHPGIRIIRPLARDAHGESLLVHVEAEPGGPAVLVRSTDAVGSRRCLREIAALHRAQGPGVVPLLDVLDDGAGPALLRTHLPGPTLARALADRDRWQAGEAVAALHPVVDAVRRMHATGVAHGSLDASCIVLTHDGAVVTSLASAELFASGASGAVLDRSERVARDRAAVRGLSREVLGRVVGARAEAAAELMSTVDAAADRDVLELLHLGLAELAAPVPYRVEGAVAPAGGGAGSTRIVPVRMDLDDAPPDAAASGEPASVRVRGVVSRIAQRLGELPPMRRRLALGAGTAVAVASLLLALPSAGNGTPSAPATSPAAVAPPQTAPAGDEPVDAAEAVLSGADPLAALPVLLARRDECFATLSVLCLEEVDQAGSAALVADRETITSLRAGEEVSLQPVDASDARIVERLGDGALVDIGPETAPASLLMMRSEAGWRIRDWIARG